MTEAVSLTARTRGAAGPFQELAEITRQFEERGGNLDRVLDVVAEDMLARCLERFELQSGHAQGPWQPFAPSTLARRRASASPKLLQDTGIMKGSLMAYSDGYEAEAYTNNPYAKYHVSPEPRHKIPLRDFFDINLIEVADYTGQLMIDEVTEL